MLSNRQVDKLNQKYSHILLYKRQENNPGFIWNKQHIKIPNLLYLPPELSHINSVYLETVSGYVHTQIFMLLHLVGASHLLICTDEKWKKRKKQLPETRTLTQYKTKLFLKLTPHLRFQSDTISCDIYYRDFLRLKNYW